MTEIAVAGGGFAGVWAAVAAAAVRERLNLAPDDLAITLFSPQLDMVIRPRLYEADPAQAAVPLIRVLDPVGVRHVSAAVTTIDARRRHLTVEDQGGRASEHRYDRLVLATGSRLVRPRIPGREHLHDVDTLPAALALDAHLHRLAERPAGPGRFTAVVAGAGFTGIELATELVGRMRAIADGSGAGSEVRVVLVERESVVGPALGPGPRPVIEQALRDSGVEVHLGVTLAAVDAASVTLDDGVVIPAWTAAWTVGMRAQALTAAVPGSLDAAGRLDVDAYLRVTGVPAVLAAGDTAAARVESGHVAMQSCQHAHAMGRVAGHNAAAELYGRPLAPFAPDPYVTCLDLGGAGAVLTTGFDREVQLTGAEAKQVKRTINRVIYPPVDDAAEILRLADLTAPSRVQTPADA